MSVLRNLEAKLEAVVEGAFSRAFRSRVQPVELARKLAKEMEESQVVSISRTYVPNEYVVFLSPSDREQFSSYEGALKKELSDYLLEHARSEGLALVTRPTVEFRTDERLGVGEFGIQAHLIQPPDEELGEHEPKPADFGHTMVYSPDREARKLVQPPRTGRAVLAGEGRRTVLSGSRVLLGRSRDCDVVLDDPNVSRRHAELRREGETWIIADLGSTNGVKVNGRRVDHALLNPGDEITLGISRLSFDQE
jgi:Protein of unknown function (DUF3662)/FHA domain